MRTRARKHRATVGPEVPEEEGNRRGGFREDRSRHARRHRSGLETPPLPIEQGIRITGGDLDPIPAEWPRRHTKLDAVAEDVDGERLHRVGQGGGLRRVKDRSPRDACACGDEPAQQRELRMRQHHRVRSGQ